MILPMFPSPPHHTPSQWTSVALSTNVYVSDILSSSSAAFVWVEHWHLQLVGASLRAMAEPRLGDIMRPFVAIAALLLRIG